MSRYEDHWSKTADTQWRALPAHLRDQVEMLVRDLCWAEDSPTGPLARKMPGENRMWMAVVSEVAVFYEVGLDMVLIRRVEWRG